MHDEDDDDYEESEEESLEGGGRIARPQTKVNPPRILLYKPWEYAENTEELGVAQVFSEVGDVMKYVKALRGEVRKLHSTIRALQPSMGTTAAGIGFGGGGGGGVSVPVGTDMKSVQSATVPANSSATSGAGAVAESREGVVEAPGASPPPMDSNNLINTNKRR